MKSLSARRATAVFAAAALTAGLAVAATGCAGHRTAAARAAATSAAAGSAPGSDSSAGINALNPADPSAPAPAAASTPAPAAVTATGQAKAAVVPDAPASSSAPHSPPIGPTATAPGTTAPVPNTSVPAPPPTVPPSSLPNAGVAAWQPMGSLATMQLPAQRGVEISECLMVYGAAAWHEQGYVSAQQTPAQEDIFGFTDAASAAKAYQAMAGAEGGCQQVSRGLQAQNHVPADATVAVTGRSAQAQAWSRAWTGVAGTSMPGPQIDHYYLVQRGATLIVASFTEMGAGLAKPYDTAGDPAVLTMLAANAGS